MKAALTLGLLLVCLAAAQAPDETAVLGGPCRAEDPNDVDATIAWHESVNAYREAERRDDLAGAAEIARGVVRGRCSN